MALPPLRVQKAIVRDAARRYGIDPAIEWGVYGAETDFGRNVSTSGAGAVGPFQFMPSTAQGMGVDPLNFRSAALGAARYLSQYKGRGVAGMLSAYNAGPNASGENPETRAYIPRVLQLSRQWDGAPTSLPAAAPTAASAPSSDGAAGPSSSAAAQGADPQRAYALGQFLRRENPFELGPKTGSNPQAPLLAILPTTPPATTSTDTFERAHASLARLAGGAVRRVPASAERTAASAPGAGAALSWAARALGTTEIAGNNRGTTIDRWQRSFGLLAEPWRGVFVGKALQAAGVRGIDSRVASTAAIVQMARERSGGFAGLVAARDARPGDVVVWNPGSGGHTGIVERVRADGTVVTIEGNASNSVRREVHPRSGADYARPAYA